MEALLHEAEIWLYIFSGLTTAAYILLRMNKLTLREAIASIKAPK